MGKGQNHNISRIQGNTHHYQKIAIPLASYTPEDF
jgi:hypothetical protein